MAVLIGTFSATGLALTDARPDFQTLGAVGASPVTRRMTAGAHALFIATLGALLGVVVGLTPGLVAARLLTSEGDGPTILDIPWLLLALLLVGLPLAAGLMTATFGRGPGPKPVRETVA